MTPLTSPLRTTNVTSGASNPGSVNSGSQDTAAATAQTDLGMLHHGTHHAFEQEDEPMIRAVRSRMHSNGQFAQRSALQSIDEAAVRGPQVLKR